MKCPKCGYDMEDLETCLNCGWHKKRKFKKCPECGEALVRGVCYRCGYRKKRSSNTCPYCHQKLVKGYCKLCDYKADDDFFEKIFFIIGLILIISFVCKRFIFKW